MSKYKVLFCRFPGRHVENSDCVDWFVRAMGQAKSDPRIEKVMSWYISDTPVTMSRNRAIEIAKSHNVDFVIMVDDDVFPDMYVDRDPKAQPFFPLAFDFLVKHNGPAMIAVPYCGPPPIENIYVFRWATCQSDHPNPDLKIDQYSREEAAVATGIEEVAALPTGLCMFHLSAVDKLKPPYFYYEWKDKREQEKASTEDVTFTRDLAFAGVPIYVAWDCWAGHWKQKCVGRPGLINVKDVSQKYYDVIRTEFKRQFKESGECPCCERVIPESRGFMPSGIQGVTQQVKLDTEIKKAKKEATEVISRVQMDKNPQIQNPWLVNDRAISLPFSPFYTTGSTVSATVSATIPTEHLYENC